MDESEDNLSAEDIKVDNTSFVKIKSKKKSLVERELETSLTARVTSPVTNWDNSSTSRYGRARRLKSELDSSDSERSVKVIKSPKIDRSPVRIQSPVYKMHASNSPLSMEKSQQGENKLETQIENIYSENISLSRFGSEEKRILSPAKKFPNAYMRQDLIQSKEKEKEESITLIKTLFSPVNVNKPSTHIGDVLERSSEKYSLGTKHIDTSSVVKTLDFDGNKKKKKEIIDNKITLSKSEIFDMEAKCEYQVGDLAWARMGTYPFWPCIVTRDPASGTFIKKKLLGRSERDILHVTFLGDNGRRGWIMQNMLRKFLGLLEFETTREKFSVEEKKRDPRLYAAFFISEKKQPQWAISVEEAETLLREPKRLRIDILRDMLGNVKPNKVTGKIEKRETRTNSDVSLSESLYDTLFSEDDTKINDNEQFKRKTRNKSLDVSEVVTACLDNMAAKTGITKIQKQSHMDRWLQKAKSKTPEKSFYKTQSKTDKSTKFKSNENWSRRSLSLRRSRKESHDIIEVKLLSHQNEHDYSKKNYDEFTKPNNDKVDITKEVNKHPQGTINESSQEEMVNESVNNQYNDDNLVQKQLIASKNDAELMQIDLNHKVQDKETKGNAELQPDNLDQVICNGFEDVSYLDRNKDVLDTTVLEKVETLNIEHSVNEIVDSKTNTDQEERNLVGVINIEKTQINESIEIKENHVEIQELNNDKSQRVSNKNLLDFVDSDDTKVHKKVINLTENCLVLTKSDGCQSNDIEMVAATNDPDNFDNHDNFTESDNDRFKSESTDIEMVEEITNLPENIENHGNLIESNNENSKSVLDENALESNDIEMMESIENQDLNINNPSTSKCESIESNKSDKLTVIKNIENNQMLENQKSESEECEEYMDSRSLKDEQRENQILENHEKFNTVNVKSIRSNDNEVPNSFSSGYSSSIPDENDVDDNIQILNDKETTSNINEGNLPNSKTLHEINTDNFIDEVKNIAEKELEVDKNIFEEIDSKLNQKMTYNSDQMISIVFTEDKTNSDNQSAKSLNSDVESITSENTEELNSKNSKSEHEKDINETHIETLQKTNWKVKAVIDDNKSLRMTLDRTVEKKTNKSKNELEDPEFLKYLEIRQDAVMDEHPELTQDEITRYLYKTWQYEENSKSESKKTDEMEQANLVKGLKKETTQPKRVKKKIKVDKEINDEEDFIPKSKSKRRIARPCYNEDFNDNSDLDMDDEIQLFDIFKTKNRQFKGKNNENPIDTQNNIPNGNIEESRNDANFLSEDDFDQVEEYFKQLTEPKPNIFKGLLREKLCEVCEKTGNLVKCKGCHCMFHVECTKKETEVIDKQLPSRGRKKKKRNRGRKQKGLDDSNGLDGDSQSDEKSQEFNASEENSLDDLESNIIVDANNFEAQLSDKMKEIIDKQNEYYSDSSEYALDWSDTEVGKCKIIDIKLPTKNRNSDTDYTDFKCHNCLQYDKPICFVCRAATSPKGIEYRQRCQLAHCNKYYHLECLEHWPQTQYHSGEVLRNNKNIKGFFEPVVCPRHVCHTCVSDDPRGCKTRFSGDKLARCVRCPATYHSFTKCLPAGSQILSASHIICPRHYEHRPGKVPCHVNTGWCFICALGGSLICCEYCPTSFHAECLNIKPPEGGYMCEDCETGCLPLYGEMVWVKLGHYRWWPGIILHPSEIPPNILAVKHSPGEFVVRFFGQYDHYWVNRGRVFPFQEGDTGKVSNQKSKIDAAFNMAMEHAQRACEILKKVSPDEEETPDFASSLLPPHYVKLKVNKPCGSLCGKRIDVEESSLTQCECNPDEEDPCGPYSQCLNRMLLTECGPTCRAGERCNNRAFEKRLYPKLVPYRTPQRGWGLKTLEDIKAGQFVIEYVGELIDEEEFKRRMQRKYEIRDENYYFLTLDKERMIDAGPKGNLARFMNHCCEPNCETQKWTVLGDVRVGLFAMRDIPANSEVTFNYNLQCAGIEKKQCLCGAKRCSGYIGAKPKQSEQPKKKKDVTKRTYKKRKVEYSPTVRPKPVKRQTSRSNPKELTEIEKDLLIIKLATSGMSSDSDCSGRFSVDSAKETKAMKRKRDRISPEDLYNGLSPNNKRFKEDD
ncbi:putative histone-lysine N-methyltransferase Mes-4 [Papilio xuthus]|nr:putative histone-lysine N-methyltransferase Mes-4 [Papilio xuthus]